jgi:transcriptional regulator
VTRFVCKRKLSQDKDDVSRRQAIAKLREPGPYEHPALADEMEREWEAERAATPAEERA